MLNIVIPMAGAGSRFSKAGFLDPKPLIPVHGIPMIKLVINNVRPASPHRFIFVCQQAHADKYSLEINLAAWAGPCEQIFVNGVTEGAVCTVLAAKDLINNNDPLMIVNSDQYLDIDINSYLDFFYKSSLDGLIMTMNSDENKWSFVGRDDNGIVSRVVEKEAISNEATTGVYSFRRGSDFVFAASKSIERDLRVNGEFYVAPVYNILIEQNLKIGTYNIGDCSTKMHGLGTPPDLDKFLALINYKSKIMGF